MLSVCFGQNVTFACVPPAIADISKYLVIICDDGTDVVVFFVFLNSLPQTTCTHRSNLLMSIKQIMLEEL